MQDDIRYETSAGGTFEFMEKIRDVKYNKILIKTFHIIKI